MAEPPQTPASSPRIRVALVDDDPHFRLVVGSLFAASGRHQLMAMAGSAEEAADWSEDLGPDVVLLDVGLPGRTGVALAGELRRKFPCALVVMVTAANEDGVVLDAIRAGAVGYVLKTGDTGRIIEAVDDALAGGAPMSPSIARRVLALMQRQVAPGPQASPHEELSVLTTREIAVLEWVAQGAGDKEIGTRLGVTRSTVKNCLLGIYGKWRVKSRTAAAVKFIRTGGPGG
ncbi:MAG TPA: response regulator transcription factor [Chthoniobacteraceae bacterium]|nr:response regulator transcription factor [Chthoniobacteraceae bacterium]